MPSAARQTPGQSSTPAEFMAEVETLHRQLKALGRIHGPGILLQSRSSKEAIRKGERELRLLIAEFDMEFAEADLIHDGLTMLEGIIETLRDYGMRLGAIADDLADALKTSAA